MLKIVPLAGPDVRGPLGLAHLPRLWMKRLLATSDALADGYLSGNRAWDAHLLEEIALDADATFAYLDTRPTYLAFEAWVREHASRIDAAAIATANEATHTHRMRPETAAEARAFVGLNDASAGEMVLLNSLEDWQLVHDAAVGGTLAPTIPAISSQSAGPLGLRHLPRFWLKALLAATDSLYEGWKSGPASGFDTWFAATVGIDLQAAVDHVAATRPTYLEYERWFAATATNVAPEQIAAHSAAAIERLKPEAVAAEERAVLGIDDRTYRLSCGINDLIDWHTLRELVSGTARV